MDSTYKREFQEYYITYILIIINIAVFLMMTIAGGSEKISNLVFFGAKVNPLIDAGQYWRLVTSMFIHIGFTHLLFNIYALISLGKYAEMIFGHSKFILIYLLSGITGSLASYIFSPSISAGASGAIFGLLGAIVAYGWKNTFLWRSGLITNLLVVLGLNLFLGMVSSGIDNYGHMGGLLGGLIAGYLIRRINHNRQNFH